MNCFTKRVSDLLKGRCSKVNMIRGRIKQSTGTGSVVMAGTNAACVAVDLFTESLHV